jgi:hypothetical protein
MGEIKIFKMTDCDWWAGLDLESCIADTVREYGLPRDEAVDPNAHELTDEELDRFKFIDGDDPINADGTPGGSRTFREQLALQVNRGDTFPQFFASTEY